jgi:RHS repeat-associated protein
LNKGGAKVAGSETYFAPFGAYRNTPTTNPAISDRRFTGHRHNNELGLIYMRARYYVPYIYRMLTPDSIVPNYSNPQSLNRYSYSHNDPVNWIDPSGHARIKVWASAFIAPPSIEFPIPYRDNPLYSNVTATFEGDGRGFYTGGLTRPSARVWHEVILDTQNPAYFITSNQADTGVTRAAWRDLLGRNSYYATGKAPAPSVADIDWQGQSIFVHLEAHSGNPLTMGAPAIDYRYVVQFDLFNGTVTLFGYHDWYPWHEFYLEVDGVMIRPSPVQYSPIGSVWPENPIALGYIPQPITYFERLPSLANDTAQYCVYPVASTPVNASMADAFREWSWLMLLNTNDFVPR